jgi:hypothetical protein
MNIVDLIESGTKPGGFKETIFLIDNKLENADNVEATILRFSKLVVLFRNNDFYSCVELSGFEHSVLAEQKLLGSFYTYEIEANFAVGRQNQGVLLVNQALLDTRINYLEKIGVIGSFLKFNQKLEVLSHETLFEIQQCALFLGITLQMNSERSITEQVSELLEKNKYSNRKYSELLLDMASDIEENNSRIDGFLALPILDFYKQLATQLRSRK